MIPEKRGCLLNLTVLIACYRFNHQLESD